MGTIQSFFQTIFASIAVLGWVKVLVVIVIIGLLWKVNKLLGLVALILFIGHLAGWF